MDWNTIKDKYLWFFNKSRKIVIALLLVFLSIFASIVFNNGLLSGSDKDGCNPNQTTISFGPPNSQKTYAICLNHTQIEIQGIKISPFIILFMALFVAIIIYISEEIDERKLLKREKDLADAVKTMPPATVMEVFSGGLSGIKKIENDYKDNKITLQFCIDLITILAKEYNLSLGNYRYAANIMTSVKFDELNEENTNKLSDIAINYSSGITGKPSSNLQEFVNDTKLLLVLKKEYSTSTDQKEFYAIDQTLPDDFSLPITNTPYINKKLNFLPGAQAAYFKGCGFSFIPNTRKVYIDFYESGDFALSEVTFSYLQNYFELEKNSTTRSILSIALYDYNEINLEGVLNIHSSSIKMFDNEHHLLAFIKLVTPITQKIYDLLCGLKSV